MGMLSLTKRTRDYLKCIILQEVSIQKKTETADNVVITKGKYFVNLIKTL